MEVVLLQTSELEEKLKNSENFCEETIEDNAPPKLADILNRFIEEKKTSKSEVIRILNIDRNHGYQILNGTRSPTRNCLIRITLILKLSTDQINYLLRAAEKPQLYVRNLADAKVFYAVKHRMEYLDAVDFIWGRSIM